MSIKVSIIVPIYIVSNKYLGRCLESLTNQTLKEIEVILVNDGMSKENKLLVESYLVDKRFSLIGGINQGVSKARNLGISHARGDFITFVDADDVIDIEFCTLMYSKAIESETECVICGYYREYERNRERYNCENKELKITGKELLYEILEVQKGVGFAHMKLIKRGLIIRYKLKFRENLVLAEDAVFCIELAQRCQYVQKINEPLYYYVFNTESVVRKFDDKYSDKYIISMKVVRGILEQEIKELSKMKVLYCDFVIYHLLLIAVNYCYNPVEKLSMSTRYRLLKEQCEVDIFKESMLYAKGEGFSVSRKIALYTIKKKIYWVTSMICLIRQLQFKVWRR